MTDIFFAHGRLCIDIASPADNVEVTTKAPDAAGCRKFVACATHYPSGVVAPLTINHYGALKERELQRCQARKN
ncbi:hypothetical protein PF003_g19692 [Phytophthora fragariae]|nr:hypothetical protein PF003_g19692 [Phytophthora fragariae]